MNDIFIQFLEKMEFKYIYNSNTYQFYQYDYININFDETKSITLMIDYNYVSIYNSNKIIGIMNICNFTQNNELSFIKYLSDVSDYNFLKYWREIQLNKIIC